MPAGPSGQSGRRTSYASVVAGTNNAHMLDAQPGSFEYILNPTSDYSYQNPREMHTASQRRDIVPEPFLSSQECAETTSVPAYSGAFAGLLRRPNGFTTNDNTFLAPSYLRNSAYLKQLRLATQTRVPYKDVPSITREPTPKNYPSSIPASKAEHTHSGVIYDVVERTPPPVLNEPTPLPSKWNVDDKWVGLDVLADGLEVKYPGSRSEGRDHEAFSIRSNHPMPPQAGIYYYEVTILSRKRDDSSIAIGFSGKDVPLNRPPGWEPESWAYHGDDGHTFACQSSGRHYGPEFATGDIIGCGVNFTTGHAFFTRNGESLDTAFREIKGKLFPSVGLRRPGEHVRVNFGQKPFVFDIDTMMSDSINAMHEQIRKTELSKLSSLGETSFMQKLVLECLSHDGYVETARAFADEITSERRALHIDKRKPLPAADIITVKEDADAINRQRIRGAILDGDIDSAVRATNAQYPDVLMQGSYLAFEIKCARFIEMIRAAAEAQENNCLEKSFPVVVKRQGKGHMHTGSDVRKTVNHKSAIPSEHMCHGSKVLSTTEEHDKTTQTSAIDIQALLQRVVDYGTELTTEYDADPDMEIHRRLNEIFSLVAYVDPLHDDAVSHLLNKDGRSVIAEKLNAAILVSLGKSSRSALERLIQQTTVLIDELSDAGGPGSYINLDSYMKISTREL